MTAGDAHVVDDRDDDDSSSSQRTVRVQICDHLRIRGLSKWGQ